MHKMLVLTKYLLKGTFSSTKNNFFGKKFLTGLGAAVLMVLLALGIAVQFGVIYQMGFVKMAVQMTFFFTAILCMVQLLYMFPSIFYFSQDARFLLPLPLKPWQIVGAKTIVVFLSVLPFAVVIGLGSIGAAAFLHALSIGQILAMALSMVLSLLSMVFIMGLIILLVMRFLPFFHNKDVFNLIFGAVSIIFAIAISMSSMYAGQIGAQTDNVMAILTNNPEMFSMGSNIIFQTNWSVSFILDGSFLSLLWLLLCTVISALAFAWCADRFYLPAVMSSQASSSSVQKKKAVFSRKKQTAFRQLLKTDLKNLLRSPTYLINCVFSSFLGPIIILIVILNNPSIAELMDMAKQVNIASLDLSMQIGLPILAASVLFLFSGDMNMIAATAITREGQRGVDWMKSIPVPFLTQIHVKLVTAYLFTFFPTLLYLVLIHYMISIPFWMDILFILTSALVSIPACQSGAIVDLLFPRLNWSTEYEALKNNWSAAGLIMANMILSIAYVALILLCFEFLWVPTLLTVIGIIVLIFLYEAWMKRIIQKKY